MSEMSLNPEVVNALKASHPRIFSISLEEKVKLTVFWTAGIAFVLYALWTLGFFDFAMIYAGLQKLGKVIAFMLPPAHNGWLPEFMEGIAETLAMAFLGTTLAFLAAIPLGFLGAKNIIPTWVFHFGLRRVFDGIRGVDQLIWALVFVNVVGLGPFAGILAIFVNDTGTLLKLFAEAIENVDNKPIEGVRASGGSRLEVIRFGILPQVLPVMLSNTLYFFESNTRSATILGVVGAGGIGLHLSDRIRVNNWDEASFIIIMILITVFLIDILSRQVRRKFITGEWRAAKS